MNEYYYIDINNKQQGPVSPTLFRQLGVTAGTLVWTAGMEKWLPAGDIDELKDFILPPASQNSFQGQNFVNTGAPYMSNNTGGVPVGPPPTYLVWAILTTLICCLPFGIVSIVYASQVESEWFMGHYDRAYKKSNQAKTWAIVAAVVGFISYAFALFTGFLANFAHLASYY